MGLSWLTSLLSLSSLRAWLRLGAVVAAVVLGLIVWSQARTIDMLNADLIAEQQRYGACSGRLTSILEDKDRDDEIDALDLNALRERASGWLRSFGAAD